ncbi:hypothetical protein [Achromobacter sp. UMC71]|uniref:hypothetical protein n=1 Tax=Achromobacter sp. UMC71 TaxID=1862320 RepID=UPI001600F34A|nr:hypothetical protein [Achromobacter sp. UMC71]MBB1627885.1 hypothetical protein [Achromobacter sp. UMC71]
MRRPIVASRQGEAGGMIRLLPRLLLSALVAVLFGGCAASSRPAPAPAAVVPASASASAPDSGVAPASIVPPLALQLSRSFSHRLLVPPLQLTQIALAKDVPDARAAMRRFAEAAPSALAARGLLNARSALEPESGWLTLVFRSRGYDWAFGLQFSVDGGGSTLTVRLRTAGAVDNRDPRPEEMDEYIGILASAVLEVFPY